MYKVYHMIISLSSKIIKIVKTAEYDLKWGISTIFSTKVQQKHTFYATKCAFDIV